MKVALIPPPLLKTPPTAYGGLEQVVYDLGVALLDLGEDVTLIAPFGSNLGGRGKVTSVIDAPEKTDVDWLGLEVESLKRYHPTLSEFDIIHDHTWFGSPYLMKKAKPNLKICHTHHGHLNWDPKKKPEGTEFLNLIGISRHMAEEYTSMGYVSKYVYNGINLDNYPFSNEKEDRLVFVGRISKLKMPHVAIDLALDSEIPIDIVGGTFVDDKNYVEYVRKKASRFPKLVSLHLDASHDEKLKLMQRAKALVAPSHFNEPFGLVAVEAMACGTSAIVLNDGAFGEVVGQPTERSGAVCNTYGELLESVKDIVAGGKNYPENCLKRAKMFSRENMAKNYLKLYHEIIEGKEW